MERMSGDVMKNTSRKSLDMAVKYVPDISSKTLRNESHFNYFFSQLGDKYLSVCHGSPTESCKFELVKSRHRKINTQIMVGCSFIFFAEEGWNSNARTCARLRPSKGEQQLEPSPSDVLDKCPVVLARDLLHFGMFQSAKSRSVRFTAPNNCGIHLSGPNGWWASSQSRYALLHESGNLVQT